MNKNYFVIERKGQSWDDVKLHRYPTMTLRRIKRLKNSTYEEMKKTPWISSFIIAAMEAANHLSGDNDDYTAITLIGEDGIFIWGILMGPTEDGDITYSFVDWKKNDKNYRYEN